MGNVSGLNSIKGNWIKVMETCRWLKPVSPVDQRSRHSHSVLWEPEGACQAPQGRGIEAAIWKMSRVYKKEVEHKVREEHVEAEGTISAKALGWKEMDRWGGRASRATATRITHMYIALHSYPHLQVSTWDHTLPPLIFVSVWDCWRQIASCLLVQKCLYFTFFVFW